LRENGIVRGQRGVARTHLIRHNHQELNRRAEVMMHPGFTSPLVSTEFLSQHLHDKDMRIIDVRWRSRYENGRGVSFDDHEGYLAGHIPGAVFAGMQGDLSDPSHPIPDMLVPADAFAAAMERLGIGNDTLVVAYDNMGFPLGSARLWWALSYYGHDRIHVLDGGLRQWQLERRPLSTEVPDVRPAKFVPAPRAYWVASKQDVVAAIGQTDTVIIDCLTPELYGGKGDRHLWGQRSGHIPGAVNVPYFANVDPRLASITAAERDQLLASGRPFTFSSATELGALYAGAGVTPDKKVITYCGRGYAGACGLLALKLLGHADARLYDGSWAEWSADPDLPAELG
jgi:thiosulfate/3-mercaptopyruvate sulfurtransferase